MTNRRDKTKNRNRGSPKEIDISQILMHQIPAAIYVKLSVPPSHTKYITSTQKIWIKLNSGSPEFIHLRIW